MLPRHRILLYSMWRVCWRAPEFVIITSAAPLHSNSHHCIRCLKRHRVGPTGSRHSLQHKAKEHSHLLWISHERWQISHILNIHHIHVLAVMEKQVVGLWGIRCFCINSEYTVCLRHECESKDKKCSQERYERKLNIDTWNKGWNSCVLSCLEYLLYINKCRLECDHRHLCLFILFPRHNQRPVVATVSDSWSALFHSARRSSPFSSSLSDSSLSRASPLKPETAESDACESLQVQHRERRSIIYELRLSVYQTDARSVCNH